jgi:diaminohydroxyphosphoribosylaminopyrimidine deaminase/5-amino-6-(5-phosphoribosylamino)uracil reductase
MYVTLEPCCHQGKTPPCTQAVIDAGLKRVVVAMRDPFPSVAGGGIAALRAAGLNVEVGLLEGDAHSLNAPYLKLLGTGRPWVIAKWAMTLDGKIAARDGSSRWISGEASRRVVHNMRGRVDAILIGHGTAEQDDPLLTARPAGSRTATRVVLDTRGRLKSDRQLVRTARQTPVLVAVGQESSTEDRVRLESAGCEVLVCRGDTRQARAEQLLDELGRRRMTNLLVEGGATLLGTLLDGGQIDEVHAFIAPKLLGGATASTAIAGEGINQVARALTLAAIQVETLDGDVHVHGRVVRRADVSELP